MDLSKTHIELVEKVYETLEDNIAKLRLRKSDSLTFLLFLSLSNNFVNESTITSDALNISFD